MSNLKSIDVNAATKKLEEIAQKAVERAIAEVRDAAAEARKSIVTGAAVLKEADATELVTRSTVALATEVEAGSNVGFVSKNDSTMRLRGVRFHFEGGSDIDLPSGRDLAVPQGKYRAFFFLVPIKE